MKSSAISTPVALIFFARPDVLALTFEAIRRAKPNKLLLIQDGPRPQRLDDIENINKCREIVSNIDWECEVFKNYSDVNLGCGLRVYSGLSWAFQYVDKLAIIEDDCVPSLGFFEFTDELLEKYKDDERIGMISGMNNLEIYDKTPYDYFFTEYGSVWGWATWKRVWDTVDFNMEFINDADSERLIKNLYGPSFYEVGREKLSNVKKGIKQSSWSHQYGLNMFLNSYLTIVPQKNLITNVGLTENSANSLSTIKFTPRALRGLYYMKAYQLKSPLNHPKYIVNDIEFKKRMDRLMANGYPVVKFYRLIESITYRIIGGDFNSIIKGFKRRFSLK